MGATEDEEEYWNDSVAKGFSWEEGDDTIGMPDLRLVPISWRDKRANDKKTNRRVNRQIDRQIMTLR